MRIRVNKLFSRYRKLVLRLKEDFHFSKWQNSGFKVCFSFSSNCVCASVSNVICKNVLMYFRRGLAINIFGGYSLPLGLGKVS